jgi:DNA-binding beta-propeller fold protein YncE
MIAARLMLGEQPSIGGQKERAEVGPVRWKARSNKKGEDEMDAYAKRVVLLSTAMALAALALAALLLIAASPAATLVRADAPDTLDWVMTVNFSDTTIHTVNTANSTVYGPFLEGQLGPSQSLLDIAVTPDGTTALVSSFISQMLYVIDVSDPTTPSLLGSVELPMFAEDIAITQDSRFALVTDGGSNSLVASVDILSRTLAYTTDVSPAYAQAVDVAPNGTVVVADYLGGGVATLVIDASGHITSIATYSHTYQGDLPWPINVGVAPDGETVIVAYYFTDAVGIYQITAPGILSYTGVVSGLPGGQQSVAFNAAGDRAYVVSTVPTPTDQLSVLEIAGPGVVSLHAAGAADLLSNMNGGLYGVDVIAVSGGRAFVGNPSTGGVTTTHLAVVDVDDYGVSFLPVGDFPIGVAIIPPKKFFFPFIRTGSLP